MAKMNKKNWSGVALGLLMAGTAGLYGCGSDANSTPFNDVEAAYLDGLKVKVTAIGEAPTALPAVGKGFTEMQYMIELGEDIIRNTNTHALTAAYIPDSGLTCSSCHRDAGQKKAIGSTFIGAAASFPAYNDRDGGVITLQDRINSCFMRSMNGTRLPANSEPLLAMTTYITWLSEGTPIKMNAVRAVSANNNDFVNASLKPLTGDVNIGQVLYEAQCASCHGTDGDGVASFPPVWGPRSYNSGAGLATDFKGASWIQFNMPPEGEFTLGNQEAMDIMSYINKGTPADPTTRRPQFTEELQLPGASFLAFDDLTATYHYGRTLDKTDRVPAPVVEPPVVEPPVVEPPALDGQALFDTNCGTCHNNGAGVGNVGGSDKSAKTVAIIQGASMTQGLSDAELLAIETFLAL